MPINVLVVDDDPGVRGVLTRFLTKLGFSVETVEDGESALHVIRGTEPDLLLLDVYLPGMSGIDVLYALQGEGRKIPTLTFSGMPDDQMQRESVLLGAHDFVYKPFSLEGLESELRAKLALLGFEMPLPTAAPAVTREPPSSVG